MSPVQFWIGSLALMLGCIGLASWKCTGDKVKGNVMKKVPHQYCPTCNQATSEGCTLCPNCGRVLEAIREVPLSKKVVAYECELCDAIFSIPCAECSVCHGLVRRLQFDNMALLETYMLHVELAQIRRQFELRMPGIDLSEDEVMRIHAFEHQHNCQLYAQPVMDELSSAYAAISSSKQASIETNRLNFARYLVKTGRLSEEIAE